MEKFTEDLNIIRSLPDNPALTSDEFRSKFDEAGKKIKEYINNILGPEVESKAGEEELRTLSGNLNTKIDTALGELEGEVNEAIKSLTESVNESLQSMNSTISSTNSTVSSKTIYSDITVEAHWVGWNGGQITTGRNTFDSSNTITKAGYYPVGVVSVSADHHDRRYHLRGQSGKGNGTITVTYRYYNAGNESINQSDMPSAIIFIAWALIR